MKKTIGAVIFIIIAIVGLLVVEGLITMGLYNTVIVNIFGVAPIDLSVAVGLMFIINLIIGLFKG